MSIMYRDYYGPDPPPLISKYYAKHADNAQLFIYMDRHCLHYESSRPTSIQPPPSTLCTIVKMLKMLNAVFKKLSNAMESKEHFFNTVPK